MCDAVSMLDLERHFLGESTPEQAARIDAHVKTCDSCFSMLARLNNERQSFLDLHSYSTVRERIDRKTAGIRPWIASLAKPALIPTYAVIAIVLIAFPVARYLEKGSLDGQQIAYKGGSPISFIYQRNGITAPGDANDTFLPGDRIQVIYTTTKKCYVALLSIDTDHRLSFYQPDPNAKECTIRTEAGANQTYPSSIVLDASEGHELVIALFSERPLTTEPVTRWADRLTEGQTEMREIERSAQSVPAAKGCRTETLLLTKGNP